MRKILLVGWCLLMAVALHAQQRTVTGRVTGGTDGSALPGVSILVKGTSQGTTSDADGNYSIDALSENVLSFSFIGYETGRSCCNWIWKQGKERSDGFYIRYSSERH